MIEFASLERCTIVRRAHQKFCLRMTDARKLGKKFRSTLLHALCKIVVVIREKEEGSLRSVLLSLKEHRRIGSKK